LYSPENGRFREKYLKSVAAFGDYGMYNKRPTFLEKIVIIINNKLAVFLHITLLGCIILPYMANILQSFPASDDMSNFIAMSKMGGGVILSSIKYTIHCYKTWQGTVFPIMLFSMFHPLRYGDVYSNLFGIENLIAFILYIISVCYLSITCLKYIFHCR